MWRSAFERTNATYRNAAGDIMVVVATLAAAFFLSYFDFLGLRTFVQDERILILAYTLISLLFFYPVLFLWNLVVGDRSVRWETPQLELTPRAGVVAIDRPRYQSAELEVANLEQLPITDCHATLVELEYMRQTPLGPIVLAIPYMDGQPDRIRWLDKSESNESQEITIPTRDVRSLDLADTANTLTYLKFNLLAGDRWYREGPDDESNVMAYSLVIRIDGRFNGRTMKPLPFTGCLFWEIRKHRTIVSLQQGDGTFVDEVHEKDTIPLLVFEEGDWMKSKRLRRAVGLPDKDRPLTKQEFLKALNKVIGTVKKKKSPAKEKKGTSG